jgi:hypothetical protein
MSRHDIHFLRSHLSRVRILAAIFLTTLSPSSSSLAVELPAELPLWEKQSAEEPIRHDVEEQMRSAPAPPGSPSGRDRAFSCVSSPTYSIHRPEKTASPCRISAGLCRSPELARVCSDELPVYLERRKWLPSSK